MVERHVQDQDPVVTFSGQNLQGITLPNDPLSLLRDSKGTTAIIPSITEVTAGTDYTFAAPVFKGPDYLKNGTGELQINGTGGSYPITVPINLAPIGFNWFYIDQAGPGVDLPTVANDQVEYQLATNGNGFPVSIDNLANVVVTSNGNLAVDTFDYWIYSDATSTWGTRRASS